MSRHRDLSLRSQGTRDWCAATKLSAAEHPVSPRVTRATCRVSVANGWLGGRGHTCS